MGEVMKMTEFEGAAAEEYRVLEWEAGLPAADDLIPLSQSLVPPVLAFAFSISPDPCRTLLDVNLEAHSILSGLRGKSMAYLSADFKAFDEENNRDSQAAVEVDDDSREGGDMRKLKGNDCGELGDSAPRTENSDDQSGRAQKRPRLVWTPQLHKRFVDVVAHLGIKSAVPKTIMQMMNVDGLTRENVASHLQKYRLYLKRIQGLSDEGPSASDQLFASTPVPNNLRESGGSAGGQIPPVPVPMPYGAPLMHLPLPMPVFSMTGAHGHVGIPPGAPTYHGFEASPYSLLAQRDWPLAWM